jgi:hypothetical protein
MARVQAFIARWQGHEGGQEPRELWFFLSELCGALNLQLPDVAEATHETNDYVFERATDRFRRAGSTRPRLPVIGLPPRLWRSCASTPQGASG